tara:strand:+ start:942 stop:1205 length:264 start_codon:yes stop_codon:yes gene_type:complete
MKKNGKDGGVFGNWLDTLKPKHLWFFYIAWIIFYRIFDATFSWGLDDIDSDLNFLLGWLIMATLSLSVFVLILFPILKFLGIYKYND